MTIVKKKARKRQLRNQRRLPVPVELVESRISLLRTHKIMIDTDLA